jgi:hypothetical protein
MSPTTRNLALASRDTLTEAQFLLTILEGQLDHDHTLALGLLREFMRKGRTDRSALRHRSRLALLVRKASDRLDQCKDTKTRLARLLMVLEVKPPADANFPHCWEYPPGRRSTALVIKDVDHSIRRA